MLNRIFKIMSFYDRARWNSRTNYNLLNVFNENISNDSKLLTHWLCYITDRQMDYKRIWDIGGFIFSELVDTIKNNNNDYYNYLNPQNELSFFRLEENGKYVFKSHSQVNNNQILLSYGFNHNQQVTFISRYYSSDYLSILYTFDILQYFNYSLTQYILQQLNIQIHHNDYIKRLLFSLYLLTYYKIGQPNNVDLQNFEHNIQNARIRTEEVLGILNDHNEFNNNYNIFLRNKTIYKQKRAWCSLRDFLKSHLYREYFKQSLREYFEQSLQNANANQQIINNLFNNLFKENSLQQLELPGDVWNDNPIFRNCILQNTDYINSNKKLNIILREYFENHRNELNGCYPEQFDITFDFVPRMCKNNNCDICPIGFIRNINGNDFMRTCVQNNNLYCTVALINCNYKINCNVNGCSLINVLNEQ